MENKYFVFGKARAGLLWDFDDLGEIVDAIIEDEAEPFEYDS